MPKSNRMTYLDHLRGFFIIVIIVDHLSRWPSLMALISGKAFLWVTAAEGFVLISGLLVGYIRAFKEMNVPLKVTAKKLLKRALILYTWTVIATIVYSVAIWYLTLKGGSPSPSVAKGDWSGLLLGAIQFDVISPWIYFLMIYAVYLAISPAAIWMLRNGYQSLMIFVVFTTWVFGLLGDSPIRQWQVLFFGAMIVGFNLPKIQAWFAGLSNTKQSSVRWMLIGSFIFSLLASVITTFYPELPPAGLATSINNLFPRESIGLWRSLVAAHWFVGFIMIFNQFNKQITKYLGWLLGTIGTQSLRAYILHGSVLLLISYFFASTDDIWVNTLLDIVAIALVFLALKTQLVRRIIPS